MGGVFDHDAVDSEAVVQSLFFHTGSEQVSFVDRRRIGDALQLLGKAADGEKYVTSIKRARATGAKDPRRL